MARNTQIRVSFSAHGTRRVRRDVGGIGETARNSATAVNFLQRSLGLLGLGIGAAEMVRFADSATRLTNQLRTVTNSSANLSRVQEELFRTARLSRSGIEPTVELYSRLQRSTMDIGLSQRELLDMTEGVSKAFKIFGNTADEAEAAMVQFSQGLASGSIKGDELRSVLEQAPRLALAIADGFNEIGEFDLEKRFGQAFRLADGTVDYDIVIGSLRNLGQEGELTAERVVRALQTQLGALDEEFRKTLPTIEDGFVQLSNSITQMFTGQQVVGALNLISQGLIFVADNMVTLIEAAGFYASAMLIAFGARTYAAIGGVIGLLKTATRQFIALNLAILANPFAAIVGAISLAASAAFFFGSKIQGITGGVATLRDEVTAVFFTIIDTVKRAASVVSDVWVAMFGVADEQTLSFGERFRIVMDAIGGFAVGAARFIVAAFFGGMAALKELIENFGNVWRETTHDVKTSTRIIVNEIKNIFIGFSNSITILFERISIAIQNAFIKAFNAIANRVNGMSELIERVTGVELTIETKDLIDFDRAALDLKELLDPREGTTTNPYRGAQTGVRMAMQRGAEEGVKFIEDTFNSRLGEAVGNRQARERDALEGQLETLLGGRGTPEGLVGSGASDKVDSQLTRLEKMTAEYAAAIGKVNAELDTEIGLLNVLGPQREIATRIGNIENQLLEKKIKMAVAEAEVKNGKAKLDADELLRIRETTQLLPDEIAGIREKVELLVAEEGIQRELQSIYASTVEVKDQLVDREIALGRALGDNIINLDQYRERMTAVRAETAALRLELGEGDWVDSLASILDRLRNGFTNVLNELTTSFGDFFSSLSQGFGDSIGRAIVQSESLGDALRNVAQQALTQLISSLIQVGLRYAANTALEALFSKKRVANAALETSAETAAVTAQTSAALASIATTSAASIAAGAATAAAWSPAAAAVSLASFGSNAAPAATGITSTFALAKTLSAAGAVGLRDGGMVTGPGTSVSDSIPALLSNGEFVVNAASTSQYLPLLKAINQGVMPMMTKYASGGLVGLTPSMPVFTAANDNSGAGMTNVFELNITVEGGGTEEENRETGRQIAEEIEPIIMNVIRREKRGGGELEKAA